jgi:sulfide:quinone oxidoreductase
VAKTSPGRHGLRVVVLGGGVAGVELMLALRALAEERVSLELVAPEPHLWYRPLAVSEPFGLGRVQRFELAGVALALNSGLTLGAATVVDPNRRVVQTDVGPTAGVDLEYDALVVATGARAKPAVEGAVTFRGPADVDAVARAVEEARRRVTRRIVFVVPAGATWPLPAYELALLTGDRFGTRAEVSLVTPETTPLEFFGARASAEVEALLDERGIRFYPGRAAVEFADGRLRLRDGAVIGCEHVIALPTLRGDAPAGIPTDPGGFIPVDEHGRVGALVDVFAIGDATAFSIKQGGIATQHADAVAASIAARAGATVEPTPFHPILRALLLTGTTPLYLRHDPAAPESSIAAREPLWWPPDKIVGRYLAPFLADHAQLTAADSSSATSGPLREIHVDSPGAVPRASGRVDR